MALLNSNLVIDGSKSEGWTVLCISDLLPQTTPKLCTSAHRRLLIPLQGVNEAELSGEVLLLSADSSRVCPGRTLA